MLGDKTFQGEKCPPPTDKYCPPLVYYFLNCFHIQAVPIFRFLVLQEKSSNDIYPVMEYFFAYSSKLTTCAYILNKVKGVVHV